MGRDLNLDGGEISVIKALGMGGSGISGGELLTLLPELVGPELIEVLQGLMMMGYVIADKQSFHTMEELSGVHFHVNSGYAKDLKEAIDPSTREKPKSKRVRRE
jgi:hypothetical protein